MHKKLKGYFTVEASFIMPIILFLYLMIILAALFLYCRSAISQDNFLLGMRAGSFSWGEEDYGEVIYGEKEKNPWQAEEYVEKRLAYKQNFYPFFPADGSVYRVNGDSVLVQAKEKGDTHFITKNIRRYNPVSMIREERK